MYVTGKYRSRAPREQTRQPAGKNLTLWIIDLGRLKG